MPTPDEYPARDSRDWQSFANCIGVDPDLFFPAKGASTSEAKAVCRGCVVRNDCLEYALTNGEKFGIWGGLSERERRRIRSARAMARALTSQPSNRPPTWERTAPVSGRPSPLVG